MVKVTVAEPLAVAVCLPDDKVSLFVALRLRAFFDERGQFEMPVFVRLRRHHRLGEFAAHIERLPKLNQRLRVFGSLEAIAHDFRMQNRGRVLSRRVRAAHTETPLRIRAMCMNLIEFPMCCAHPF